MWRIQTGLRQLLIWCFLLFAALLYIEVRPLKAAFTWRNVAWGGLIGLIVSVPALLFGVEELPTQARNFYGAQDVLLLLCYEAALAAVLVEELYFRGFVQRELGFWAAVGTYAGYGLVLLLPNGAFDLADVLQGASIYAALGFVQSYVYRRYGLSAALASRFVLAVVALLLPLFYRSLST
jgi:hypothetical protein